MCSRPRSSTKVIRESVMMLPIERMRAYLIAALAAFVTLTSPACFAILPIQTWQTPAGARVLFVENRSLPMLDVSIDFPAGSAFDAADKAGRAALTQQLLRMGAGGMNESEIARRLADVGAQLGGRFDFDRAGVSLRTLSSGRERDAALDVLARIVKQPEFPRSVFERERERTIAGLQDADTRPDVIARLAFNRALFRDHPYGIRVSGEVDTLKLLSNTDLEVFYRSRYVAERTIVAIIGDVSRAEAERIGRQLTDGLPSAGTKPAELPAVAELERAVFSRLDHPASQSHILVGAPAIDRSHPDYFPLFVGNHVLGGGGFSSRLTDEVRQKRGLAYSVYSLFVPLVREGPFQIGLQTQGDQATEALDVVMKTLKTFLADGPTEGELAQAKDNIVGGFPLRIDSNRKILEYLATIGFYNLPLTYLDDFVKCVDNVTIADVRAAFARNISAERLVTVIVGGGGKPTAQR